MFSDLEQIVLQDEVMSQLFGIDDVVSRACERMSLMVIAQFSFESWMEVFSYKRLSEILLDCLMYPIQLMVPAIGCDNSNTGSGSAKLGQKRQNHPTEEGLSRKLNRKWGQSLTCKVT
jgi:hypothetical protein